jgi:hypothetical protein
MYVCSSDRRNLQSFFREWGSSGWPGMSPLRTIASRWRRVVWRNLAAMSGSTNGSAGAGGETGMFWVDIIIYPSDLQLD